MNSDKIGDKISWEEKRMYYVLGILIFSIALTLITSYICFLKIFYSGKRKVLEEYPIPDGEIYEEMRESFVEWLKKVRALPCREVSITSHDGLRLSGRFFEYSPDATIEILFHGYRGCSESDLTGGVLRCRALGHSALIVDHRASGQSEGHVITFGALEKHDCLAWVDFVLKEINPSAKIIITGISMGAATVCLASAEPLPDNVIGVLADCPYTSAEDIIKKIMKEMHLPENLLFPFVRLGARIFGGFDIDEASPVKALEKSRLPVIFFHGDNDAFVPWEMSEKNYSACRSKKRLVIIKGAGHGLCYPVDREKYLDELRSFFK